MHPARLVDGAVRRGVVAPVSEHHEVAATEELARHASGDRPARLGVDDLGLDVRMHRPDRGRSPFEVVLLGGLERDR